MTNTWSKTIGNPLDNPSHSGWRGWAVDQSESTNHAVTPWSEETQLELLRHRLALVYLMNEVESLRSENQTLRQENSALRCRQEPLVDPALGNNLTELREEICDALSTRLDAIEPQIDFEFSEELFICTVCSNKGSLKEIYSQIADIELEFTERVREKAQRELEIHFSRL